MPRVPRSHWIRSLLGGAIVVSISIVYAIVDAWSQSHLLALGGPVIALGGILIAERKVPFRWVVGVTFPWALVAIVALWIVGPAPPEETPIHGWLEPANDPMPISVPNWPACKPYENSPTLLLGSTIFNASKEISDARPFVRVGSCPMLSIKKEKDGLLINADVYDQEHNLVARIDGNNEFHLVPNRIAYPFRPDRSTIGAVGEKGDTLLFVRYANQSMVHVWGTFSCPNTRPLVVTDKSIVATNAVRFFGNDFSYGGTVTGGCVKVREGGSEQSGMIMGGR